MVHIRSRFIHWVYVHCCKPVLFVFDPERVHDTLLRVGEIMGHVPLARWCLRHTFSYAHPTLTQTVFGMVFTNPVGLAAGFDKDAQLVSLTPDIGFGFAEVGTVTLQSYAGNPRPRLVRVPSAKGILVNYGLKSKGVENVIARLQQRRQRRIPMIVSVGKTNSPATAAVEDGIRDYAACCTRIVESGVADIIELNISCPNTFGGEPFTTPELLRALLSRVQPFCLATPLLLKMPINLPWEQFQLLLECASQHAVAGVVIGNLNKDRTALRRYGVEDNQCGALSGKPTWDLSNDLISKTYAAYEKRFAIIGVGGIFSADDAYEKVKRGATLVQLITGMIYEGPQLIGEINRGLVRLLQRDGYRSIHDAIGAYHR